MIFGFAQSSELPDFQLANLQSKEAESSVTYPCFTRITFAVSIPLEIKFPELQSCQATHMKYKFGNHKMAGFFFRDMDILFVVALKLDLVTLPSIYCFHLMFTASANISILFLWS